MENLQQEENIEVQSVEENVVEDVIQEDVSTKKPLNLKIIILKVIILVGVSIVILLLALILSIRKNEVTETKQFDARESLKSTFSEDYTLDPETLLFPYLRGYAGVPDLYIAMSMDSDLKELVRQFVALTPDQYGQITGLAELILFQWTGVEDVDPTSRGPHFDAQKLEALEAYLGITYLTNKGETNPRNETDAGFLNESWDSVMENTVSNLLVQMDFGGIFNGVTYDLVKDAPYLFGSVEDMKAKAMSLAPTDPDEALEYWAILNPIFDKLQEQSLLMDDEVPEEGVKASSSLIMSQNIDGWTTYRNERFGYEVSYPPVWDVEENEETGLIRLGRKIEPEGVDSEYAFSRSFSISVSENSDNKTVADLVNDLPSTYFYNGQYGKIDGQDSFVGDVSGWGMAQYRNMLIVKDNQIFDIGHEYFYEISLDEFDQIMDTFRFIEKGE